MMKKMIVAAALLGSSMTSHAVAPGGAGCGWGNMLFEGESGMPMHVLATLVNGTSGNRTFGITSGTNGCDTSGELTYDGENLLAMAGVLEEVAADVAVGNGEALTALSVALGVKPEDRAHFNQVMQQHFTAIFPSENVTAEDVVKRIASVMKQDARLAAYI